MNLLFEQVAGVASSVTPTPFFLTSPFIMDMVTLIGGSFIVVDAKSDFLEELNNVVVINEHVLNRTPKLISFSVTTVVYGIVSALAGFSTGAFSVTQESHYRTKAILFTTGFVILSFIILNFDL